MKIVPKGICLNLFGFFLTQDKSWIDRYVINHELIHSAQQKELLWIPFYIVYLAEWLLRLYQYGCWHKAYMNISFEKEAYKHGDDLRYLSDRKHYASVRYDIDYVNSIRTGTGGTEFDITDLNVFNHRAGDNYVTGDAITSNGGWINAKISDDFNSVLISDKWDLQPFKNPDRLPNFPFSKFMHKYFPNFEVIKFVGGDPFLLKQSFKIK